jgi:predicted Holliday junction resolvase-like endonuclease
MHQQTLLFFQYQRQIFGICTCCGEFFRLSDCKVYQEAKAPTDWLDKLEKEERRLDLQEEKVEEELEVLKAQAREKGRQTASKMVKQVDKVFHPQKLNPDDAKVIFHPVDFVVFNGMKAGSNGDALKNVVLLDSEKRSSEQKQIQKSIIQAIDKQSYEWLTIRVDNDGSISQE